MRAFIIRFSYASEAVPVDTFCLGMVVPDLEDGIKSDSLTPPMLPIVWPYSIQGYQHVLLSAGLWGHLFELQGIHWLWGLARTSGRHGSEGLPHGQGDVPGEVSSVDQAKVCADGRLSVQPLLQPEGDLQHVFDGEC